MSWRIVYTRQAEKDAKKISKAGLKNKAEALLKVIEANPFSNRPPYKKLVGDLSGEYSRRINIRHRLVYRVLEKERIVKVESMWAHY